MPKKDYSKETLKTVSAQIPEEEAEELPVGRKGIRAGTIGLQGARMIDISRIKPDPDQPRKTNDKERLAELAQSLKDHGMLQPITVEYLDKNDYFKVITGERRYEAAKIAGLSQIPCLIKDIDKRKRLIHQLIENIQRQDLAPLEEAQAIQTLINNRRLEQPDYSQNQAAKELGLAKSYLSEILSLLKLPEDIKHGVRTANTIPKRLLILLLRQNDEKTLRQFFKQIQEGGKLTIREVNSKLKKLKTTPGRPKNYQYEFRSPEKDFVLKIKFNRAHIETSELTKALQFVLRELKKTQNS